MKGRFEFGKVEIEADPESRSQRGEIEPETPLKILLIGPFSGRTQGLKQSRPIRVDRDNFEAVLSKMNVQVEISIPDSGTASQIIQFRELDDFHPDQLYRKLPLFRELRSLHQDLQNPATFRAAAEQIQQWGGAQIQVRASESTTPSDSRLLSLSPDQLLKSMLGEEIDETGPTTPSSPPARDSMQDFLGKIATPHLQPGTDPRQPELLARLNDATGALMRRVLHDPAFQQLEALWRGLFFLISRLETDEAVQIWVWDIPRNELLEDLTSQTDFSHSRLYATLITESSGTPGAIPWGIIAGLFELGNNLLEIEWLTGMARLAELGRAPFLAGASPRLLGLNSFQQLSETEEWSTPPELEEAWNDLRRLPASNYLGLVLPRFLLRLPYGQTTDALEKFEFEEMSLPANHQHFLWGSPALACVYLMAESYLRNSWEFQPGEVQELAGLPFYVQSQDGEDQAQPCAEILMTFDRAEKILEQGLMLLLSFKGCDFIRLARFQSISDPLSPLRGLWDSKE
jgi:type VI secretion system protein ImpC